MLAVTLVNKTYSYCVYAFWTIIFRKACQYFQKCFIIMTICVNFNWNQVYVYFINILLYTRCLDFKPLAPNIKYM
jgi:hypothetical protein